ncbi:hypothetical protein [Ornithinibacillus halophilus]|uniref:Uncharacterized protein n=1 Tax=Ornithinibacillus halophilus TaxID=930117 RepID=A0A1M5JWZ9_9BACI|nr:hypothetical protein [Ornithinibacillus halophilus]SHG45112.1 hypothetical protein SAMN05216225_10349 [Ornithinibacillus halophilus]
MAKDEKLNEEAALNNNLGSSTLRRNRDIQKQHQRPQVKKNSSSK